MRKMFFSVRNFRTFTVFYFHLNNIFQILITHCHLLHTHLLFFNDHRLSRSRKGSDSFTIFDLWVLGLDVCHINVVISMSSTVNTIFNDKSAMDSLK